MIIIKERGLPGHFCCSDRCAFRRNTLVSNTQTGISVVVSSVGAYYPDDQNIEEIGYDRYYETMCFIAHDDKYKTANVSKEVSVNSPWNVSDPHGEILADKQHDDIVNEISERLENGEEID